tara:strand:+ start:574 stop:780 length:207 start_codon:yes stop_codon:yes gene_type:complete
MKYCEWCGDTKDNLYDDSYGLFCDKICALKDELEKHYYHKYNDTEKSNDKVRELFLTKSYNEIKQIIL